MINKVVICGMGVMGGSLGFTLVKNRLVKEVCALVRRKETINTIYELKIADTVSTNYKDALQNADLLIMAIPPGCVKSELTKMRSFLEPDTIVTDICSVKGNVVKDCEDLLKGYAFFVGSHPMTGTEKFGFSNFIDDLYKDTVCLITPTDSTSKAALKAVETFWHSIQAKVVTISAKDHDNNVAIVSHLPHVLSYLLMYIVSSYPQKNDLLNISAGSFRDMTRVAGSSPELWMDIFLSNKTHLVDALSKYQNELTKFISLMKDDKNQDIMNILQQAFQEYHAINNKAAKETKTDL